MTIVCVISLAGILRSNRKGPLAASWHLAQYAKNNFRPVSAETTPDEELELLDEELELDELEELLLEELLEDELELLDEELLDDAFTQC